MTASIFRPQTSSFQPSAKFARILVGLSFICIGFTLMYTLWYSDCPKPFSGDGFMNCVYIKAALWVAAGLMMFSPRTALSIKPRTALVMSTVFFLFAGLMLYVHSLI